MKNLGNAAGLSCLIGLGLTAVALGQGRPPSQQQRASALTPEICKPLRPRTLEECYPGQRSYNLCQLQSLALACQCLANEQMPGSVSPFFKVFGELQLAGPKILLNLAKMGLKVRFDLPHGSETIAEYAQDEKLLHLRLSGDAALLEAAHAIDDGLFPDSFEAKIRRWFVDDLQDSALGDPARVEFARRELEPGMDRERVSWMAYYLKTAADPEFIRIYKKYFLAVKAALEKGLPNECKLVRERKTLHDTNLPFEVYMYAVEKYLSDPAEKERIRRCHPDLYDWVERSLEHFASLSDEELYQSMSAGYRNKLGYELGVSDKSEEQRLIQSLSRRRSLTGYCTPSLGEPPFHEF